MNITKRYIAQNYYREIKKKTMLVYHATAGNMPGCEEWLNFKTDHVNVPFILLRNGDINEYFNPKYWAYHTGVGKCQNSIPLEIENWGNLSMTEGLFLPWTKDKKQAVSPERVLHTEMWRGFEWWEMLTSKQVISLEQWTDYILALFPEIAELVTHAEINSKKLDFPPEFMQVYDIINRFKTKTYNNKFLFNVTMPIAAGEEYKYNQADIQSRINWLIKNSGWHSNELNRLVSYRDRFLK